VIRWELMCQSRCKQSCSIEEEGEEISWIDDRVVRAGVDGSFDQVSLSLSVAVWDLTIIVSSLQSPLRSS
jgi:hypothetical protein